MLGITLSCSPGMLDLSFNVHQLLTRPALFFRSVKAKQGKEVAAAAKAKLPKAPKRSEDSDDGGSGSEGDEADYERRPRAVDTATERGSGNKGLPVKTLDGEVRSGHTTWLQATLRHHVSVFISV